SPTATRHHARLKDAVRIDLRLQARREGCERALLRLERTDCCAHGRRGAHQRGVPSPVAANERAQQVCFRITTFHANPDQPALPIVEDRSEEHTSELQSRENLVCRLLLEK